MSGVFSHLAVSPGTRLFLDVLTGRAAEHLRDSGAILDLGCGYGPVGIVLATVFPRARLVLADVDATALAAHNAALNAVATRAEARLSDGLRHLGGTVFDAVVSHFPLHIPRGEQMRLLQGAHDGLCDGGRVYLATLAAYDLRPALRAVFGHAETLAEGTISGGQRYRVVTARRGSALGRPPVPPAAGPPRQRCAVPPLVPPELQATDLAEQQRANSEGIDTEGRLPRARGAAAPGRRPFPRRRPSPGAARGATHRQTAPRTAPETSCSPRTPIGHRGRAA